MALYQPTNIIPSSYTKGTVDVNETMEISWQVNGNSAMTAFQIDFYLNDANSTYVTSTGKKGTTPEEQKQLGLPFYGTDRFGRPQFFTWNAGKTWENWSLNKLTNGNEYKYKITQWYKGGSNYELTPKEALYAINQYYFNFTDIVGQVQYITFRPPTNLLQEWAIGYDAQNNQAYFINGDGKRNMESTQSTTPPAGIGEEYYLGEAINEESVTQNSFSVLKTRSKPTLSIVSTDENYQNCVDINGVLKTSIGYFSAQYKQAQDNPIRWIRWQVATANNGTVGEILSDTGDIYTPTLNYEFNGFFNGHQYAIRAIGESESGQSCDSGWILFTINIENQGEHSGNFTVQCLNKENATLLEWNGVEVIPPTTSPQGYDPQIANGSVTLNGKDGDTEYSVTWNKVMDKKGVLQDMNFLKPWTAVWKGKINLQTEQRVGAIYGIADRQRIYNGETYWYYSNAISFPSTIKKALKIEVSDLYTVPSGHDLIYELVPVQTENGISVKVYLMTKTEFGIGLSHLGVGAEIKCTLGEPISPKGKIFSVLSNTDEVISVNQNSDSISNHFTVTVNGTDIIIPIQDTPTEIAFIVTPNNITTYFYLNGNVLSNQTIPITYTQQPITSISIYGGDSGATVDSVSVYKGDRTNILSLYENPDFEPVWNSDQYKLYMTANFNGNLEGGTGTAAGKGFRVYRQEVGKNVLTPIATVPSTTTSIKDYGIVSRKAYKYSLYAYDNNGAFMSAVENEKVVATCFKNYSLLVCDYDEENDEYHVRKQYLFALNLSTGSVGNNNSPTLNANFTRYPTRMPSTQNYASGTLQGLIGAIYTVPALVEQIGNYKWTAKPSTLDYFDSVDLEQELYDLSTAPYQLFLRDMKGRLRMVATNGAITMTTNIKQKQQSISISFPWVEIGDASDVAIIQTPDDYGWNNDNQVLDVSLDVDVATGELSATYPYPYNGTKFYLTGVNKETLTAKTPLGITPAQFNLSETASKPDDGELNAMVKVNSEDN